MKILAFVLALAVAAPIAAQARPDLSPGFNASAAAATAQQGQTGNAQ
jgi:hypothetical protein